MTKQELIDRGLTLIPISEVNINLDSEKTIGYDFTVSDNYTFSTSDGIFVQDTMALYFPLSIESQAEIKEKMTRIYSGESSTEITIEFGKEQYLGIYMATKDSKETNSPYLVSEEDIEKINDPYKLVTYRNKNMTAGRAALNSCFPRDYQVINYQVNKKEINKILGDIVRRYSQEVAEISASKIYKMGFKFATIMGTSITLDQIEVPKEIYKMKEKLDQVPIDQAQTIIDDMKKMLAKHLKDTGIGELIDSGAGKSYDQPMQILVAKGIVADATGNVLPPIKGSFSDGLTNTEYFNASYGARAGIVDRVLTTAPGGYLSRKLVYVLNDVEVDPFLKDCKTDRTLDIKLTGDIINRLHGRYIVKNGVVVPFDPNTAKFGETISLRSPIFCRSKKICHTCYGNLISRARTPYVGILAATLIGERGQQTAMKQFHLGGVVSVVKRDMLQDILQNNPELKDLEK